ncbi:hypothetical protein HFO56_03270 [Rhizobium laguerreae]|uniref:hypothetical protein n=1 Tax=Rhizobium laguerreae TaxID=1076926 RepID=UPI001C90C4BE|nr:hypothetical protein [Rhizobium laguerreae]MBY3151408.1 hypothetical protein [Rhizobium laguerreae]
MYPHPEDGPEDEMEKWSPDQWDRLFADVKKKEDVVAHASRFNSDVKAVEDAGFSVEFVERGAIIGGRVLISNRGPSWKTARSPSWYGYPNISKLIHFLQTGEWEQTAEARRSAEKRALAREKKQVAEAAAREKVKAENREERERQAEILRGVKERRAARLAAKREDREKRKAASDRAKQRKLAAGNKSSEVANPG